MSLIPLPAAHWLAGHHGVASLSRLESLGMTRAQVYGRARSGHLVRVHRGVYRSAEWPCTPLGDCLAACLAVPGGAISHTTAARLWGLRRVGPGTDVHLTVRESARVQIGGVHVHRASAFDRGDTVRRADGIRVTNPLRTVCDLAVVLDDEDVASAIEQVLDEFHVRFRTLLIAAERRTRRGSPGAARLRRVLTGRPAGRASQSHLEVRVATALRRSGLGPAIRQLRLDILPGVTVHADLAYPAAGLAVEVDHRTWHSGSQMAIDKRRDRLTLLAGWSTVRVTDDDIRHRFDETIGQIAAIHASLTRRRAG